ncbi:MAG: transporter substrate-binding protein, partial [Pseudomonadota bacterium]
QSDFIPLDVSDFTSTINKIQTASPDIVISALVGGAHLSFYRQWAAAGMNKRIPIASSTIGVGNEHQVLNAEEGNGIIVAYNYAQANKNTANQVFLDAWRAQYGNEAISQIHETAVSHYQGIMLWAEAVKQAGTKERSKVIEALEQGVAIDGPSGNISIDRQTHHAVLDVHVMEIQNQAFKIISTHPKRQPLDTQKFCNLQTNPNDTRQYEINI